MSDYNNVPPERKSLGRRVSFAAMAHVRLFEKESLDNDYQSFSPISGINLNSNTNETQNLAFQMPDLSSVRRSSDVFNLKLSFDDQKTSEELEEAEKENHDTSFEVVLKGSPQTKGSMVDKNGNRRDSVSGFFDFEETESPSNTRVRAVRNFESDSDDNESGTSGTMTPTSRRRQRDSIAAFFAASPDSSGTSSRPSMDAIQSEGDISMEIDALASEEFEEADQKVDSPVECGLEYAEELDTGSNQPPPDSIFAEADVVMDIAPTSEDVIIESPLLPAPTQDIAPSPRRSIIAAKSPRGTTAEAKSPKRININAKSPKRNIIEVRSPKRLSSAFGPKGCEKNEQEVGEDLPQTYLSYSSTSNSILESTVHLNLEGSEDNIMEEVFEAVESSVLLDDSGCKALADHIKDGRASMRALEETTLKSTPGIFFEFIDSNEEGQSKMLQEFKTIKLASRLLTKEVWYGWREKIMKPFEKAILENLSGCEEDLALETSLLQRSNEMLGTGRLVTDVRGKALEQIRESFVKAGPDTLQDLKLSISGLKQELKENEELRIELAEKLHSLQSQNIQLKEQLKRGSEKELKEKQEQLRIAKLTSDQRTFDRTRDKLNRASKISLAYSAPQAILMASFEGEAPFGFTKEGDVICLGHNQPANMPKDYNKALDSTASFCSRYQLLLKDVEDARFDCPLEIERTSNIVLTRSQRLSTLASEAMAGLVEQFVC
ncbi:hypothetical protein HDU97_004223 [Phlyctochytrium planicorne]|nr:hypothetical protein HDU97_004223 [Phlyctochytrium planicorne]